MAASSKIIVFAAVLGVLGPSLASAQSAGSSSSGGASGSSSSGSSSSGVSGPTAASPAPSGGVATGRSAAGPETPIQKRANEAMKKDTTICKGC